MIGTFISSMSPNSYKGTLFTREQVEEISDRISQSVTDEIYKQLSKAISSAK